MPPGGGPIDSDNCIGMVLFKLPRLIAAPCGSSPDPCAVEGAGLVLVWFTVAVAMLVGVVCVQVTMGACPGLCVVIFTARLPSSVKISLN